MIKRNEIEKIRRVRKIKIYKIYQRFWIYGLKTIFMRLSSRMNDRNAQ